MSKEKKEGIKLSVRLEKIIRDFCARNHMDPEIFLEEAVIEKMELEEIRSESGVFEKLDELYPSGGENFIADDFEEGNYKKKH